MQEHFSKKETRLISGISLLLGIRMLGTSMVYPVISIFATGITGSTEILAGLAFGIFGIFQTLLQIPLGMLSDRWGRKETAMLGFGIFLGGTILSGLATDIYMLIAARAIAGAGAVSGVTMTWLTEGIGIRHRNRALSYVGMSIGLSVIVGISISSVVAGTFGFPMLFFICAGITGIAMVFTSIFLGNIPDAEEKKPSSMSGLLTVLRNRDLLRLYVVGFASNFALSGMFFTLPVLIDKRINLEAMWQIYAPMAILGTGFMFFFGKRGDTHGTRKIASIGLIMELAGVSLPLAGDSILLFFAAFVLFYSGHCILQPILPAAVSRCPAGGTEGAVMSAFNSAQFTGSALGGMLAGAFFAIGEFAIFPLLSVLVVCAFLSLAGFQNFSVSRT